MTRATSRMPSNGSCVTGTYICADTSSARPYWRTSPTTPTISYHWSRPLPGLTCWPIASPSGKCFAANAVLTIITGGESGRSASLKLRPFSTGTPLAAK